MTGQRASATGDGAPLRTIGVLARLTGCKVETIRYYERIGLLPAPARSRGGHRHYRPDHLRRLAFIRRARALGFTLDAVRALLDLADGRPRGCAEAAAIAAGHLEEVRGKRAALKNLERVLADLIARCREGTVPHCPLIEALFAES